MTVVNDTPENRAMTPLDKERAARRELDARRFDVELAVRQVAEHWPRVAVPEHLLDQLCAAHGGRESCAQGGRASPVGRAGACAGDMVTAPCQAGAWCRRRGVPQ